MDVIMCGGKPTPGDLAKVQEFMAALSQPTEHLTRLALLEMDSTGAHEIAEALAGHRMDPEPWEYFDGTRRAEPLNQHPENPYRVLWTFAPRPEFCQYRECYTP